MKALSEQQLWGAYSEIPERTFICDDGHHTRVRTTDGISYCKYLIGARTTCSRPAKPRGAPIGQ